MKLLELHSSELTWSGPFFQNKTIRNKGSCQIDLLFVSKFNSSYVCEIKTGMQIDYKITTDVQNKIDKIHAPKRMSFRPILIVDEIQNDKLKAHLESYFDKIIYFDQLFSQNV